MTVLMKQVAKAMTALSVALLLASTMVPRVNAQDRDDPPTRVARLAYIEGSVSFEPAGESDWVQADLNRPMTTGDRIWADKDSRAELQLGSARIDVNSNSGFSFLNLDDRTVQIELTSGAINVRVRHLDRDDVFEIDTPNQAFSLFQPGRYRVEASEDGNYTVVSVREGEGESTGNGQTYTIRSGQRVTLEGTSSLNAQMDPLGGPDAFDNWCYSRYNRFDNARSGRYVSRDVVGYDDLDDYGDWRPSSGYGDVWFPRVAADWAPYREGHWAWIDPWGWTWVDDDPWGYAPFHYGRWLSIEGRWGWVPGPISVEPVYAPALVVFVGGGFGFGGGVGGGIAWFPLGPREVYVPPYGVSRDYIDRVNVSNTTVSTTTITNVYNTTIVNKSTTITNVNYVNRSVAGAVTAVPQQTFVSAQPVAKVAVKVNPQQVASAPVVARAAVAPTSNSVLGIHANTANHVTAPPPAVANRPVVAKAKVPPPPPPFAARQQILAAHPGQPIPRQQLQNMRPTTVAAARPPVKQAPPGRPATPAPARPGNPPPAARPSENPAARPQPAPSNPSTPLNRPAETNRPPSAQPNRPEATPPQPSNKPEANRPEPNRPETTPPQPSNKPEANRPEQNRPEANRPEQPPARTDRPPSAQPNRPEATPPQPSNKPEANRPEPNRPEANRPEPPARTDRPPSAQPNRPEANRPEPSNKPAANRPEQNRPEATPPKEQQPPREPGARSSTPPAERQAPAAQKNQKEQPRAKTPEEKKKEEEKRKQEEKQQEKPPV